MITIRKSSDRGRSNLGWLKSHHTFSFADYHDPKHMGVSALRVINDDTVTEGQGFATHSHADMEIISYVKSGTIEHKDSMGNIETLPAGEFQLMSAGRGVTHSEYNPSQDEILKFLQIWVQTNEKGLEPSYQQKRFENKQGLQLIVSPDGKDGSLLIHQDASMYQLHLGVDEKVTLPVEASRTVYVHVVSGSIEIEGETLKEGDGATVKEIAELEFKGLENSEALVFDLP